MKEEVGSGRRPARVTRAVPSEERPTVSPIVHTLSPKFATTTTFSNRKNLNCRFAVNFEEFIPIR